jgi:lipoprotein-anchoring transpeptidase ErfK/SrfK
MLTTSRRRAAALTAMALGSALAMLSVLSDWPGGGVVGIHGTDRPDILPGRVSHGCIRVPNPAVRRLAKLMPIGTPVLIV